MTQYAIGRQVGSVFQDPKSHFFLSDLVGEVAFTREISLPRKIQCRTDAAEQAFHLAGCKVAASMCCPVAQNSGCHRLFMCPSRIYACDEPTANLDDEGIAQLLLRVLRQPAMMAAPYCSRAPPVLAFRNRSTACLPARAHPVSRASSRARSRRAAGSAGNKKTVKPPSPTGAPFASRGGVAVQTKEHFRMFVSACGDRPPAITGRAGGKTSLALVLSGLWREMAGKNDWRRKTLISCAAPQTGLVQFNDTGRSYEQRSLRNCCVALGSPRRSVEKSQRAVKTTEPVCL